VATVDYASNTAQRTPCILVLDASGSMSTKERNGFTRIQMLNQGIAAFHAALTADDIALSRVQVAIVNVGGPTDEPELILDWTDAEEFQPFELVANHSTPLGRGVSVALDAIEQQKSKLRSAGIAYTRPWMMIITDGEPTDDQTEWNSACESLQKAERDQKVQVYPVGVGEADLRKLGQLSQTPPMRMDNVRFRELFVWLSASLGQISRSVPGGKVQLPSTDPWAAVKL
jgi:uncharacterized protein YegL